MKNNKRTVFIEDAGACIVSKSILDGSGKVKWLLRENPADESDCGWRFFSDTDCDIYLSNPKNLSVVDFNQVASIEPALLSIYDCPIGSDLQLVSKDGRISFYDNLTGGQIENDS